MIDLGWLVFTVHLPEISVMLVTCYAIEGRWKSERALTGLSWIVHFQWSLPSSMTIHLRAGRSSLSEIQPTCMKSNSQLGLPEGSTLHTTQKLTFSHNWTLEKEWRHSLTHFHTIIAETQLENTEEEIGSICCIKYIHSIPFSVARLFSDVEYF